MLVCAVYPCTLRAYGACRVLQHTPRSSTRTCFAATHGSQLAICGAQSGGRRGMGRCAGDESDGGVGVRIQRAVLSRAHSTGLSAFRTGGAAARSRAVARGRAGAHARRGDRGMYALRVAPSGVRARSNRMRGWRARADRRVHDVHPAGGSPTAGPIARRLPVGRRLSGRAGALRSYGARGLGRPCSARRRSPTSW